ncbi:hypothetical protein NW766_006570 [Fusarium irregulare]|uniref:Uncharacterized protein n=1 Tax=Fusarium irregulare TaxID=2494466 RepID=A0A9W8PNR5_9HYPO|nr:hypothetical protein NW766_006570 [Fusarium irregulare]
MVLTAQIFHRTIEHNSSDHSQGQVANVSSDEAYWQRHREIDNDLKFMLLMLPKTLCLPENYKIHNAVFVNSGIMEDEVELTWTAKLHDSLVARSSSSGSRRDSEHL